MKPSTDKRFSISDVSEQTQVPAHLLRQWEQRFAVLRPRRTSSGHRFYTAADIEIVKRIKYLLRHDKMTTEGARRRLAEEIHGEGRPRTRKEALELVDKIEQEVQTMLNRLENI